MLARDPIRGARTFGHRQISGTCLLGPDLKRGRSSAVWTPFRTAPWPHPGSREELAKWFLFSYPHLCVWGGRSSLLRWRKPGVPKKNGDPCASKPMY